MSKRDFATAFLKMVVANDVKGAYDRFIAPDFIHHNQYFKGDRQSLLLAMEEANKANPGKTLEVKHVYEAGDTVITHSLVKLKTGDAGVTVFHVFRFKGAKVVELWDVGQQLMADSPNEHGPF